MNGGPRNRVSCQGIRLKAQVFVKKPGFFDFFASRTNLKSKI